MINYQNFSAVKTDVIDYLNKKIPHNQDYLHVSEVGSFMWGTGNEGSDVKGHSDHDIFVIYQESTRRILRGYNIKNAKHCDHGVMINNREYDFTYIELGHFIKLLTKGNVNMVWGITSPLCIYSKLGEMRSNVADNITKFNCISSGNGMAHSQIIDMVRRKDVRPPVKSLLGAYRTLWWLMGIYFEDRGVDYDFMKYKLGNTITLDECENINELLKQITQQEKVTQRGVLEIAGSYNLTREEKDTLLKLIHDMLIKLALITEKYY